MSSMSCMANHFRKWPRSPRIWMVFLIMMTYCTPYFTTTIRQFCQDYDAACTGWLLPLALTVENRRLWIMLLPMLLFCDAPFLDEQQPFLIVRTGRLRWGAGQILYIFAASAVFYLVSFLIMALMLLPYLEFSLDWGKVIRTLSPGVYHSDVCHGSPAGGGDPAVYAASGDASVRSRYLGRLFFYRSSDVSV